MPDVKETTEVLEFAKVLQRAGEPKEAARELAYAPPAEAKQALHEMGLEKFAHVEEQERRRLRAEEARPELRVRALPVLKQQVARTDVAGFVAYWPTWVEALQRQPERREEAILEAVSNIRKGYGAQLVQLDSRLYPALNVRYPDDILSEAFSRVSEEERAKWGPERLERMTELTRWNVEIAEGRIPRDTPPPYKAPPQEASRARLAALVILNNRKAAPFQVLDAQNLHTAMVYGARLADIVRDMHAAVNVLKTLTAGASLLLLPLGGAVTARLLAAGFSRGTATLLGNLTLWRTFSLTHKLRARGYQALGLPVGAEKPYGDLVEAVKDLTFSIPQIPELLIWALIIADVLGYLEIPTGE